MGTSSSKPEKRRRRKHSQSGSINQDIDVGAPLPFEQEVLMNMNILFNFIHQHTVKLYPQAVQETLKEFGRNHPPIDGMKLADMILHLPPPLRRKKTWKEVAGRKTGGDGYRFGDFTASLARQASGSSKQKRHRESIKRLFFQYRAICNEMSQQELVDMALKFFPHYAMKDCIEGMRMFQEIHRLQRKLYEDLYNLIRLTIRLTRETLYHTLAKTSKRYKLGLSFDEIETLVEQITKAEELSSKPLPKASPEEVKLPTISQRVLSLMAEANGQLVPVLPSKIGETQSKKIFFSENNASFLDLLSSKIKKRNTWRYLQNSDGRFKTVLPIYRGHTGCVMGMLQPGYKRILV